MLTFIRTDSENTDFINLVAALDADLKFRDGEEHSFYSQFNKIDTIKHAIVAYENNQPVGCGAIKAYSANAVEVKRMYVPPACRGRQIASQVLHQLEQWAKEMNYAKCILETGKRQPEAIALYKKNGYVVIPNFGQYENVENSLCFEKTL